MSVCQPRIVQSKMGCRNDKAIGEGNMNKVAVTNERPPTPRPRQGSMSTINFNRGSGFKIEEPKGEANGARHWSIQISFLDALAECPE